MSNPDNRRFFSGTEALSYYIRDYHSESSPEADAESVIAPALDALQSRVLAELRAGLGPTDPKAAKSAEGET